MIIETISIQDVHDIDKCDRFNSNNHWVDNKAPSDYRAVLEQGRLEHWIDKFHKRYGVIKLSQKEVRWIQKAYLIGNVTFEFPRMYLEELEEMDLEFHNKYFVRTNSVSLKNGIHGPGPYQSVKQIVESLVTNREGHNPLNDVVDGELILYLLPWRELHQDREFRVFVCNNQITAISQQHLYSVNETLQTNNELLPRWVDRILAYFETVIKERITHVKNYTIDLVIMEDDETVYFIEINCFGKEYAAGSALFHWILDEEILYGRTNNEEFTVRYVIP